MMKPPMKIKMMWDMYAVETSRPSRIPIAGKRTNGIRAVMEMGMASEIHHIAIRAATARVLVTSELPGSRSVNNKIIRNDAMPRKRPNILLY